MWGIFGKSLKKTIWSPGPESISTMCESAGPHSKRFGQKRPVLRPTTGPLGGKSFSCQDLHLHILMR